MLIMYQLTGETTAKANKSPHEQKSQYLHFPHCESNLFASRDSKFY